MEEINQIKEIEPNLNELEDNLQNSLGPTLPWCVVDLDENIRRFSI